MVLSLFIPLAFNQAYTELTYKPLNADFIQVAQKLEQIDTDDKQSIQVASEALEKFSDPWIRHDLIYWELVHHYGMQKQYNKCLELLLKGQKEKMFFFIADGKNTYPEFLPELKKLDGYDEFIEKNNSLRKDANETMNMEYMVQLPSAYEATKMYPMLFIFHGGIGSINDMQYYYQSEKLQEEFVVVYFQGGRKVGSGSRRFTKSSNVHIQSIYNSLITKYSIDTNNVIMAGPSAGAMKATSLVFIHDFPSKNLLLSFGLPDRKIDSTHYKIAAAKGVKVALLCGEEDWTIKRQIDFAHQMDLYGIENRFVIFPEKGHEYPNNWKHHLETSLDYLLKED